ncbi:MAG: DNA polymerase III subunit delta [Clostridia bacterium]|nr:DNA polymerase III subunit delta [Clostridia bacterium]
MNVIKESDFRKEIKSAPRAGYFFFGEEDYLKAFALRHAREILCPDETFSIFNEMKLDGIDLTPNKILDAMMPIPMMADKKLITISGLNFNTINASALEALCEAFAQLSEFDYNVLIINIAADGLDVGYLPKRPSSAFSKLSEHLTPVNFEKCSSAKLAAWVQKHFEHNGVQASPALCAAMPDFCGHSMFTLAGEIDKLSFYTLWNGETLATEENMRLVCTPALEYDTFAFTNAIMEGNREAALAILADYRGRRIEPTIVLSEVSRVICDMVSIQSMTSEGTPASEIGAALKLHEFRVSLYQKSLRNTSEQRLRRALRACTEADETLKGSSVQGYTALERLICAL